MPPAKLSSFESPTELTQGAEKERLPLGLGALGQVFTPPALVEFILDQAGFVSSAGISSRPLLEPACGAGAFLIAAARRLAEAVDVDAGRLSPKARAQRLTDVLARNLWGIDVDAKAVRVARNALRQFLYERTGVTPSEQLFAKNIIVSDFLLHDDLLNAPPIAENRLSFIIGNPPYVPTTELTTQHKNLLRGRFSTASGRIDLYGLFIEKAIALLPKGGLLSFIVPDKFLHSQTARILRAHMLRAGAVRSIACFDSHRVFDDAATVPSVFVLERGAPDSGSFRALDCDYRNGIVPAHVAVNRSDSLPTSRLKECAWRTRSNKLEAIAEAISSNHPKLGQLATRISAGLATGRDAIYVVSAKDAQQLDPELLHRAVGGRDIGQLKVHDRDLFILIPFTFSRNGSALVDIRDYPRTYRYLREFRPELEARHCVRVWGKEWFDIHDPVLANITSLKKILVPDIAAGPRFVFDNGHRCPLHSAYYIVPKSMDGRLLAAILNSKPIEFLIRMRAPVVKDGFNRYRRQFLIDLPIPKVNGNTSKAILSAASRRDFETLNTEVAGLFELSDIHVDAIDNHLSRQRYRQPRRVPG